MPSGPQPPDEFSFTLWTMFVVVTITACAIAATISAGLIVGVGVEFIFVGYWLAFRLRTPENDLYLLGWILAAVGVVTSLIGLLEGTIQ